MSDALASDVTFSIVNEANGATQIIRQSDKDNMGPQNVVQLCILEITYKGTQQPDPHVPVLSKG
ncbi:hypothetical protein APSETT444_008731 [Aspergillus pseudonomiae]